MTFSWIRRNTVVADAVVATAVLLVAVFFMALAIDTVWFPQQPDAYMWTAVICAIAWPVSRHFPRSALCAVAVMIVVTLLPWYFLEPYVRLAPLILVAFRAARKGVSPKLVIPVLAVVVPLALEPWILDLGVEPLTFEPWTVDFPRLTSYFSWVMIRDPSQDVMMISIVVALVALGYALHRQQIAADDLKRRNIELHALRASERERVAIEVQTKIARDIHDVVAHHVAAMVVTAQAADRVADLNPGLLRSTVRAIAAEGDEALAAMRRVVQVLRSAPNEKEDREPFDRALQALTERLDASGRRVEITGNLTGTTEFVEGTAFRIIQESLTNVMLHSDAHDVQISLATTDDDVEIVVRDSGPMKPRKRRLQAGNGLRGMKERASALGGTVVAEASGDGGWVVTAVLPRSGNPAVS